MTTNVLDLRNGIAASDSRWSVDTPDILAYVDDAGFDKVSEKNRYVFLYAGNSLLIQKWKDYVESDGLTDKPTDTEMKGLVAITITDMESGHVIFERTQSFPLSDARFAGSGALPAMQCWMLNGCAKRAVSSAISTDSYSGGEIKYHDFCGDNNLDGNSRVEAILQEMAKRGMIMYKGNAVSPMPIQEAALVDPRVKTLLDDISAGKVEPCAPCMEMHMPWEQGELRRLDRALSQVLNRR